MLSNDRYYEHQYRMEVGEVRLDETLFKFTSDKDVMISLWKGPSLARAIATVYATRKDGSVEEHVPEDASRFGLTACELRFTVTRGPGDATVLGNVQFVYEFLDGPEDSATSIDGEEAEPSGGANFVGGA